MNHKRVVLGGNLFWGMQFRTCKNFWDFADLKSSLNPKNSYKYKSHTAITSIAIRLANQLRIKCEFLTLHHCETNRRFAEAIHTYRHTERSEVSKQNKSARSATNQKFLLRFAFAKSRIPLLSRHCEGDSPKQTKNQHNGAK